MLVVEAEKTSGEKVTVIFPNHSDFYRAFMEFNKNWWYHNLLNSIRISKVDGTIDIR